MSILRLFIIIIFSILSSLQVNLIAQVNIEDANPYVCGGGSYTYALGFLASNPIRVNRVSGGTYSVNTTNETITVTWNESFGSGYVEFIRPDDYGCNGPCGDDFFRYSFTEKRVDNISITKIPNINTIEFGQSITLTASLSGVHTSEFDDMYRWVLSDGTGIIHSFSVLGNQIICTPSDYYSSYKDPKALIFEASFQACGDPDPATIRVTLNPPMPSVPTNGFYSRNENCEDANDGSFRITRMSLNGVSYSGTVTLPESVTVTYAYANGAAGTPPADETITSLPFRSSHSFSPESYSFYIRQANGNTSTTRYFTIDPGGNPSLSFEPAITNCTVNEIGRIIPNEINGRPLIYQYTNYGLPNVDSTLISWERPPENYAIGGPGNYVFRVFTAGAEYCASDHETFVNPAQISLIADTINPQTCTDETGSITVNASNAYSNTEFTLMQVNNSGTTNIDSHSDSDGSNGFSAIFSGVSPGMYRVHAIDGCSDEYTTTDIILEPLVRPAISVSNISTTDATCYRAPAAILVNDFTYDGESSSNLTISGYSFRFIIGGQSFYRDTTALPYNFDEAFGGDNWQLQVIHSNSACGSNIINVPEINDPEQVSINIDQIDSVRCFDEQNGSITVSANYGNSNNSDRNYTISPDPNNVGTTIVSSTQDVIFNGLPAGNYSITVTDGCQNFGSSTANNVVVENYDEISASLTSYQMSCHNVVDGSILVSANGGVGDLDFEINPSGDRVTASTTDGTNYTHTFGQLDNSTTYSITVYDVNNCSNNFSANPIINPPPLQFTTDINDFTHITCWDGSDGSIPVIAEGGTGQLYFSLDNNTFFDGNFNAIDNDFSYTFNGLPACDTTVYLADENGCSLTQDYVLTQPQEYLVSNYSITGANCFGGTDGSLSIQASGGTPSANNYTYNLMDENSSLVSTYLGEFATFNSLPFGNYYVDISDSRNCPLTSETRELSQPEEIIITPLITSASCYDSENITLTANVSGGSGSYIFSWKDINDDIIGTNSSIDVYKGTYFIDIIDTDNCAYGRNAPGLTPVPFQFRAERPDTLKLILDHLQNVDYNGLSNGSVSLSSDGGWSFHKYSHNGIDFMMMPLFTSLPEGDHMFWVQDGSGCRDSLSIYISQPDPFNTNFVDKQNVNCFERADGWISLNADGGIPPYTFSLDDGQGNVISQQNNLFQNLPEGNYTPSISYYGNDLTNPYTQTLDDVLISQPLTAVLSEITDIQSPHCSLADGSATVNTSGGTSPYTYLWSNGQTSVSVNNLTSGNSFVQVTDANGCIDTSLIMLYDLDGPQLAISEINHLPCFDSENTGSITLTVSGGTSPYSVQWNDSQTQTGLQANNLEAGSYSATVTDNEGCISILEEVAVTRPTELMSILESFKDPTCFNGTNGSITINATGGTPPYNYQWQNLTSAENSNSIENLAADKYYLHLTDVNNCLAVDSFELKNPEEIIIDLADSVFICQGQIATLDAGNMGSLFQWSSENGFESDQQIVNIQEQGDYTIIISNVNGCSNSKRIHIKHENRQLEGAFLLASEATMSDTVVLIEISWPVPDSVEWTIPDNFMRLTDGEAYKELIPLQTGEYTIGMKAYMAGCQDIVEKTITIVPAGSQQSENKVAKSLIQEAKLFPNPNTGVFEVEVKLAHEADIRADVFSMQGMRMMPTKYDYNKKEYLLDFNLLRLQPGVYFVNIYVENEVRKLKFVVN